MPQTSNQMRRSERPQLTVLTTHVGAPSAKEKIVTTASRHAKAPQSISASNQSEAAIFEQLQIKLPGIVMRTDKQSLPQALKSDDIDYKMSQFTAGTERYFKTKSFTSGAHGKFSIVANSSGQCWAGKLHCWDKENLKKLDKANIPYHQTTWERFVNGIWREHEFSRLSKSRAQFQRLIYFGKYKILILMEMADVGDFSSLIYVTKNLLRERDSSRVAVVLGLWDHLGDELDRMHEEARVIHGDLKPENILVSSDNQLYLTDFFGSGHLDKQGKGYCRAFTRNYLPPERRKNLWQKHTSSVDLFSLGLTTLFIYKVAFDLEGDIFPVDYSNKEFKKDLYCYFHPLKANKKKSMFGPQNSEEPSLFLQLLYLMQEDQPEFTDLLAGGLAASEPEPRIKGRALADFAKKSRNEANRDEFARIIKVAAETYGSFPRVLKDLRDFVRPYHETSEGVGQSR